MSAGGPKAEPLLQASAGHVGSMDDSEMDIPTGYVYQNEQVHEEIPQDEPEPALPMPDEVISHGNEVEHVPNAVDGGAETHDVPTKGKTATATTTATTAAGISAPCPTKRRGRPPGRPNQTVKEEEYEGNAHVQLWNACRAATPAAAVWVRVRDALTENMLVHDTQRAIYLLPSKEFVYFVTGWITARHIANSRPSYVNGLLIHSRGQDADHECAQCVERRAKNALGPFLTCRVLPGQFHNSCSNCKWFDNTSACSLYTGPKPNRKRKPKEVEDGAPDGDSTPANTPAGKRKRKSKGSAAITNGGPVNDAGLDMEGHPPGPAALGRPKKPRKSDAVAAAAAAATASAAMEMTHSEQMGIDLSMEGMPDGMPSMEHDHVMQAQMMGVPMAPMHPEYDMHGMPDASMVDPRLTGEMGPDSNTDAQLAAQLLPEINRQDGSDGSDE